MARWTVTTDDGRVVRETDSPRERRHYLAKGYTVDGPPVTDDDAEASRDPRDAETDAPPVPADGDGDGDGDGPDVVEPSPGAAGVPSSPLDVECGYCGAGIGVECVTSSGNTTSPHKARREAIA